MNPIGRLGQQEGVGWGLLYRDIYSKSFKKNSSQKYFFSEVNKPGKLTLVWDLVVLNQNCESHDPQQQVGSAIGEFCIRIQRVNLRRTNHPGKLKLVYQQVQLVYIQRCKNNERQGQGGATIGNYKKIYSKSIIIFFMMYYIIRKIWEIYNFFYVIVISSKS